MNKEITKLNLEPLFQSALLELIDAGFDIYIPDGLRTTTKITFAYFVLDNSIGYLQFDRMSGIHFSTVHKPNRTTGTGFIVADEITSHFHEYALKSFCHAPFWASSADRNSVVKFKNWKEYADSKESYYTYRKIEKTDFSL